MKVEDSDLDQIKNEIGWLCSTYDRNGKCLQNFGWKTLNRDHLGELCRDGMIVQEWILDG